MARVPTVASGRGFRGVLKAPSRPLITCQNTDNSTVWSEMSDDILSHVTGTAKTPTRGWPLKDSSHSGRATEALLFNRKNDKLVDLRAAFLSANNPKPCSLVTREMAANFSPAFLFRSRGPFFYFFFVIRFFDRESATRLGIIQGSHRAVNLVEGKKIGPRGRKSRQNTDTDESERSVAILVFMFLIGKTSMKPLITSVVNLSCVVRHASTLPRILIDVIYTPARD